MFESKTNLAILKKAFDVIAKEQVEALPSKEELSHITFSEEYHRKMDKLIKAERKPYFFIINTVGKRVACIIIAVLCALTTVTFSVKAIREPFINFIVETFEKFSTVFFAEKDIPQEVDFIETYYAPTYIPEGYELIEATQNSLFHNLKYKNSNNENIYFTQNIIYGNSQYLDTEDAYAENIKISDYNAYFSKKDGSNTLFWNDENYTYTVFVTENLSKDELIKIAESVKPE